MTYLTIKDVAGQIHKVGPFNLSNDPRGVAMDAAPHGLRRRAARDQELDDLFNGMDEETAFAVASMLLDRFPGLKERIDRLDASEGENNGNGDRGFRPHLKPGGAHDRRLASDSRIPSIEQMAPGFDKVGTGFA